MRVADALLRVKQAVPRRPEPVGTGRSHRTGRRPRTVAIVPRRAGLAPALFWIRCRKQPAQHDHAPRIQPPAAAGSARSCSRSWPRWRSRRCSRPPAACESDDVADVEDAGTISKADFDHWLRSSSPSQPQPGQKKPPKPPKPGSRQYDAVKQQVMQFLVSAQVDRGRGQGARPERDRRRGRSASSSRPRTSRSPTRRPTSAS